jgi:hypothetical protein
MRRKAFVEIGNRILCALFDFWARLGRAKGMRSFQTEVCPRLDGVSPHRLILPGKRLIEGRRGPF